MKPFGFKFERSTKNSEDPPIGTESYLLGVNQAHKTKWGLGCAAYNDAGSGCSSMFTTNLRINLPREK